MKAIFEFLGELSVNCLGRKSLGNSNLNTYFVPQKDAFRNLRAMVEAILKPK